MAYTFLSVEIVSREHPGNSLPFSQEHLIVDTIILSQSSTIIWVQLSDNFCHRVYSEWYSHESDCSEIMSMGLDVRLCQFNMVHFYGLEFVQGLLQLIKLFCYVSLHVASVSVCWCFLN